MLTFERGAVMQLSEGDMEEITGLLRRDVSSKNLNCL